MWFDENGTHQWSAAARHLVKVDRKLGRIIAKVGPCGLEPGRDYFGALCRAIYSQQLSTKVAATLIGRFRDEFPRRRPTPQLVKQLVGAGNPEAIRRCGLSRQKAAYLLDLSEHFIGKKIATRRLRTMSDDEVIEALVAVKGIGRWTAEMFLMFVLNRPDILPVDDLGLREGVREIYDLRQRPTPKQVTRLAEPWRPYRSIGTWYVWKRASEMKNEE